MEQKMFCYQCQETAGCKGCTKVGVCGKQADTALDQDKLILATKRLSLAIVENGNKEEDVNIKEVEQVNIQENQVEEEESNFRGDLVEEDTDEYNEEIVWSDQNFKEE